MGHRVLVVDDFPDAARAAAMLLRLLGHEVATAHSGRDALAVAESFQPDIVILDVGLPDLSGYDVARELRQRQRTPHVHIAALTGWGQPSDRIHALAAGFDQHVLKPADATKLKAIIQLANEQARTRGAARTSEAR
jgi:two-component system, OmpR family, response regulator